MAGVTKHKFAVGQRVFEFKLLGRVRTSPNAAPNLRIKWRVECSCGTILTVPQYYLTRKNPKKSCGHLNRSIKTDFNQEYRIWLLMHERTENPTHVAFKHYGGRGIRVCTEWHKSRGDDGFKAFLEFIGPRPSTDYSVDRVDNNLGYQPYQPNGERQVRWATAKEQRANQRTS